MREFALMALFVVVAFVLVLIGFSGGRNSVLREQCVERCKPAGAVFSDGRCGCEGPTE